MLPFWEEQMLSVTIGPQEGRRLSGGSLDYSYKAGSL